MHIEEKCGAWGEGLMEEREFSRVVEAMHDAAIDFIAWPAALDCVADALAALSWFASCCKA